MLSAKEAANRFFQSVELGTPAAQTEARRWVVEARLTEAEILTIASYLLLAAKLESGRLNGVAGQYLQVLGIHADFTRECNLAFDGMLPGLDKPTATVKELLSRPPGAVVTTITKVIANYHALHRPVPKRLKGLTSPVFEHPSDRAYLSKLRMVPGVDNVLGPYLDHAHKRPLELELLAGALHVTETSLPWAFTCLQEVCDSLDIRNQPELYVMEGGLNAYTTGADEPIIVLHSGALNCLDRQELKFVLGHEMGHILAGHAKYGMLAQLIAGAAGAASYLTFGLSSLLANTTLLSALYAWMRRSEFTADRAGLLACQDRETVLRAMLKMTGYPLRFYPRMRTRPLLEQVERYRTRMDVSTFDRLLELNDVWGQAHPRTMMRVVELQEWIEDGGYAEVQEASPERLQSMAARVQEDPQMQDVAYASSATLTNWSAEHFQIPKSLAGPIARRMLGEQQSPAGTPLEPILRVELQISKISADKVEYNLNFLVHEDEQAVKYTLPLPLDPKWDATPEAISSDFIHSGDKEQVRLLYTPK
ncbi:MAG: M48 family metallopeptidase [Planctomycetes bacterium]|nr:M48 family metallopeptidase [Planctomycetota bacterium]